MKNFPELEATKDYQTSTSISSHVSKTSTRILYVRWCFSLLEGNINEYFL